MSTKIKCERCGNETREDEGSAAVAFGFMAGVLATLTLLSIGEANAGWIIAGVFCALFFFVIACLFAWGINEELTKAKLRERGR